MTLSFHKLLLSELRMVTYRPGNPEGLKDELLCKAVTLNENLRSMGFVLKPDDLLRLAASPSLEGFFEAFRALVPEVTAKPMYPGFPQQVMEMSEAEFRLHQMMHYFSTYDVELLLGKEVKQGWLPEYDGPERTEKDIALMECRVLALVAEADAPIEVLKVLLGRRERLTNPELELALECAAACVPEQMQNLKVRFKENLDLLFPRLMRETDRVVALAALHAVCAHAGDVMRCAADYLRERRYHLSTSKKVAGQAAGTLSGKECEGKPDAVAAPSGAESAGVAAFGLQSLFTQSRASRGRSGAAQRRTVVLARRQ